MTKIKERPVDWLGWIDAEREAAERRCGSADPDAVAADERYGRALEVYSRRNYGLSLLASAEHQGREMDANRDRS